MSKILSEWKFSSIKHQFSLPENLVYCMAKNPSSPKVYNKLIKCCKYFWLKNPIITLEELERFSYDENWKAYKINGFKGLQGSVKCQELEIDNLNEKLWIHWRLDVSDIGNELMAASLFPRIYRCDLTILKLYRQSLTFDEFQKFTSPESLEELCLYKTTVKNADGTIVPVEKLIELLPKLQVFDFHNVPGEDGLQTITSETAANLIAISHFSKLKRFSLYEIPESFDFETFFASPKVRR